MFKRPVIFLCARMYDGCSWFTLKGIYIVWTQRSQCLRSILRSKNQLRLSFLFWIACPFTSRVLLWWSKPYSFLRKETFFLWKRNAFLLDSALFPNQIQVSSIIKRKTESGNHQKTMEQHHVSATGAKQTEALSCKVHKTCTGAKKNTNFELQSAPNLRRDKNNKVLNFKVHQTCTGTKKTKTQKLHNLSGEERLSL